MNEQLLRVDEVARRLDVSLATAYRWMKSGVLPVDGFGDPDAFEIRFPSLTR